MFLSLPPAFGLDISDTGLKLVWLSEKGGRIHLKSYGRMRMPEGFISRGEIRHPGEVARLIRKLVKEAHGKVGTNRAVVNLPETRTYIKVLEIEPIEKDAVGQILREEIKNHFPLPVEETHLKWEVLESPNPKKMRVLVGVAPKTMVESYIALLELAGLTPKALEIEARAISRSLLSSAAVIPGSEGAKMIIDLGANRSSLIIHDNQNIQFSLSLPISGNQITREISETLKIDEDEAEKIKIKCGLDETRCQGALRELITLILNDLAARIRDALVYYYDTFSTSNAVDRVVVCGGGARLIGVTEHLTKLLKLPVTIGNPFINFKLKNKNQLGDFPVQDGMQYTTAIGLALKGLEF